jgi:hypothetical protein
MELEPSTNDFQPPVDRRPRLVPPPPVRLVAVADARLEALAGQEKKLHAFYVGLLGFEVAEAELEFPIAYQAENGRLLIQLFEKPFVRDDMRALGIEVKSLPEIERRLIQAEMPFLKQKGLHTGQEALLLEDPGGNWIQLVECRLIG